MTTPSLSLPLSRDPSCEGRCPPRPLAKDRWPSALPMHHRAGPAAPSLPPNLRDDGGRSAEASGACRTRPPKEMPAATCIDEVRALAWVRANLARDPGLAAIFDDASHTTWKPLIDFVRWAIAHNLLQSLPTGREVQR